MLAHKHEYSYVKPLGFMSSTACAWSICKDICSSCIGTRPTLLPHVAHLAMAGYIAQTRSRVVALGALHVCADSCVTCLQNKSRIDIGRLRRLSSAFGDYTTEGLTASTQASLPAGPRQPAPALDKTTADALKLVFGSKGSYAQVCAAGRGGACSGLPWPCETSHWQTSAGACLEQVEGGMSPVESHAQSKGVLTHAKNGPSSAGGQCIAAGGAGGCLPDESHAPLKGPP